MRAVATANAILFMVLLLVWLSTVVAERGRSAFPSTSTGERRENMSQLFFCFRSCDSLGDARARCLRSHLQPLSADYLSSLDIGMRVTRGDWDCAGLNGGGNHSRAIHWEQLLKPRARNIDRRGSRGGGPGAVPCHRVGRPGWGG